MNVLLMYLRAQMVVSAVMTSYYCREDVAKRRYTKGVWWFTTVCWMGAIVLNCWQVRTTSESSNSATIENICSSVVTAIHADPGNPALAQVASSMDIKLPTQIGGEQRRQLHAYVRAVAKSWDDAKSYNPPG